MNTVTVTLDDIESVSRQALIKHGAAEWVASSVAKAVRKAEENSNLICGLYYLESYCIQLTSGRVSGDIEPVVSKPKLASVAVDARFGFAQAAFERGLPDALNTVKETGTCSLAICHSHSNTIKALSNFLKNIDEYDVKIIGIKSLIKKRENNSVSMNSALVFP